MRKSCSLAPFDTSGHYYTMGNMWTLAGHYCTMGNMWTPAGHYCTVMNMWTLARLQARAAAVFNTCG